MSSNGSFRSALTNPGLRHLLAVYVLGAASLGITSVVVAVELFTRSGEAGWASVGVAIRVLPFVLLSSFAGVLGDRLDGRLVIGGAVGGQVAAGALVAIVVADGPLWLLAAVGFLAHAMWTPGYPVTAATLPRLVDTRDLAPAVGLLSAVESIAWVVGPGLGGLLLTTTGPRTTALVASALAAAGVAGAMWTRRDLVMAPRQAERAVGFWSAYRRGLHTVISSRAVLVPLSLLLLVELIYGAGQVLLLLAATDLLGMSSGGFGALNAALGAGAFAALMVVNRIARSGHVLAAISVAVVLCGAPLALVSVLRSPLTGVPVVVLVGLGLVVAEVLVLTVLQRNVPGDQLSRVFGILDSLLVGAIFVGSTLAAPLANTLGLRSALVTVGIALPALALAGVPLLRRARDREAVDLAPLQPTIELLAGLPVLRAATRIAVESIAAASRVQYVAAGTAVVTQDEPADDFYAIVRGEFDVQIRRPDGTVTVVRTLGPGHGFGELGLLHDVPRTATVIARTAGELVRVPGTAFLTAVGPGQVRAGSSPAASVRDLWAAG